MKIFFVGDIVGEPGRKVFEALVPKMKASGEADVVIANAENAAGGSGITEKLARDLFACGADVLTLGDHAWDRKDLYSYLTTEVRLLRPANFPPAAPGKGAHLFEFNGIKVLVVALLGRTFIKYVPECPFRKLDEILAGMPEVVKTVIVDMHAEATSEKIAMGWYADGRVSALLGTHTHIQTADEKILPQGTAYITDVGMTGPYDSVIGQVKERIIERYLTTLPNKFEVASGAATLCGVMLDIDEASGRARSIRRVQRGA